MTLLQVVRTLVGCPKGTPAENAGNWTENKGDEKLISLTCPQWTQRRRKKRRGAVGKKDKKIMPQG